MAYSYSSESIEELKNRIDIVDVIGRDVKLKRAGANFKGLCPFHNEKTPSFVVSEQKQYFTCFGCGARGDVIEYEKKQYNLEFAEAVEKLANENGITLEKKSRPDDTRRSRYYDINKMAARFFYEAMTTNANAGYSYMKGRGISDATLKRFGIGFADGEWTSLTDYLTEKGVAENELIDLGLASKKNGKFYDKFRSRVIFPIINTSGKVIGFGGRAINDGDMPKYLNSPENLVFKKKNNLYGLTFARKAAGKEGFIILVEGYMDAISLAQAGVENAVASLGTALTENQAKLLHRYTGDVVLSYDADSAGRKAANRGMDILRAENCRVRVLHVTDGKDPDEYVKKYGKDAFLELIDNAYSFGEYKLESAKQGLDLTKDEDKVRYIKRAASMMADMDPVETELYSRKLADEMNVSQASVEMEIEKQSQGKSKAPVREDAPGDTEEQPLLSREKYLIKIVFSDSSYVEKLKANKGIIETPSARRIMNGVYKERASNDAFDKDRVIDSLSEYDQKNVQDALDGIVIKEGQIEKTYDELVRKWRLDDLTKMEKEIIVSLSLADDEVSGEKVKEFQNELIEIQSEKNRLKM